MIQPQLADVWELLYLLDILTCILFIEIGIVITTQYLKHLKEGAKSNIFLSFALFTIMMAVGSTVFILRRYFLEEQLFDTLYKVGVGLMSMGGILFSITLEHEFKNSLRTHYLISILNGIAFTLVLTTRDQDLAVRILNIAAFSVALVPCFFLIYMFIQSRGRTRTKMVKILVGSVGFLIPLVSYAERGYYLILEEFPNPAAYLIAIKIVFCFFVPIMISGFLGAPLLLEIDWKDNLLAFYVIDVTNAKLFYTREFSGAGNARSNEKTGSSGDFFAGGITGAIQMIREITQSDQQLNIIDEEKVKLLLESGETITGVFVVRKNLGNLQFFLSRITEKIDRIATLTPNWFQQDCETICRDILRIELGESVMGGEE